MLQNSSPLQSLLGHQKVYQFLDCKKQAQVAKGDVLALLDGLAVENPSS